MSIQRRRLSTFVAVAANSVPIGSPTANLVRISGTRPLAMTTSVPDPVASRAAWSLVTMPPRPRRVPAPPARASTRPSMRSIRWTSLARGSRRGSEVYRPSMSESNASRSASTRFATTADRLSLSPKTLPPIS